MKMQVIVDAEGQIVATAYVQPAKDAPVAAGVIPETGQISYEVDVPENLAMADSVVELHRDHRVEVKVGTAKLAKAK